MNDTHYVPAIAEHNGRQRRAVCGTWIRVDDHTAEPTCRACRAWLEVDAADDGKTAEDVFGPFDPSTVVKHVPFDSTAGYKPRERNR